MSIHTNDKFNEETIQALFNKRIKYEDFAVTTACNDETDRLNLLADGELEYPTA